MPDRGRHMVTSLVLDALLVLIIVMMVPLGFLRGGLREVSTSAALFLGILMAEQWSGSWLSVLTGWTGMGRDAAGFTISVVIVVAITGIVGYGGSAAFSWKPGPGGRMYGAYLALLNAVIFIGFLINSYIVYFFDGRAPETIENAYVSRAISVGFEWVLLAGTIGILGATLFGMFVRERGDAEESTTVPTAEDLYHIRYEPPRPEVRPLNDPEDQQRTRELPAQPVRIREVRHWEDEASTRPPEATYGSGWRQTWPEDRPSPGRAQSPSTSPPTGSDSRRPAGSGQREVLREWMKSEKDRPRDE
jgi:Colicin V production protein